MVDALETTGRLRCVAELSADCQEIRAVAVVTLYDDGSAIRLRDIVVSAQRRREGFGSLLLDEIVLLGRDKFENVYWRVFDSDQAPATFVSFLLSNGFAHTPDEMGLILRVAGVKRSPAQRLAIREGKQAAKWWNEAFAQPWYEESRING
jgi:GNAT superfamily N-acetyltransferase